MRSLGSSQLLRRDGHDPYQCLNSPRCFARAIPSRCRSRIRVRSNSATASHVSWLKPIIPIPPPGRPVPASAILHCDLASCDQLVTMVTLNASEPVLPHRL